MKGSVEELEESVPIQSTPPELELWGGLECTFNRVGDRYFNQMEWSGHLTRPGDLDAFAELGIKALRYPMIWEMLAPARADEIDWRFADERLPRLRQLGVRPIVNLEHHGSGPVYAPVDSADFAPGLAKFAGALSRRYPWIDAYTPVNEPLTTARFCGLYGLWFPHGRADEIFVRILANECRATILAMRAVREVNPKAMLIQTDDLGKIYATPKMEYEAEFQNHRRWLGWDLVCGKVRRGHPLWRYLIKHGLTENELLWFQDHACPPDVIGINHYPTSDRFLDEHIARYVRPSISRNGRDEFADVEAVRVRPKGPGGFHERLMEAWNRYRLPVAVTESHLGCTREEQVRWFAESWKEGYSAREDGADVRAVTAWSLLGAYNWNTLVTRDENYYEPGVFDVRGGEPRPTAIAALLKSLAAGEDHDHPALEHPGWWRRPERLFDAHRLAESVCIKMGRKKAPRQILVLGATGTLGREFSAACEMRGLPHRLLSRADLDLSDGDAVERVLGKYRPWAVINATGYVRVDDAEGEEAACFEVNTEGPVRLAMACIQHRIALLCFSSDLVFNGSQQVPYLESDETSPLNAYGRSKAAMEAQVLQIYPEALIARTSAFFGPTDDWNFVTQTLRALHRGDLVKVADDMMVSPTYLPDLVAASFDLLIDGESGIWHLANSGEISWAELARAAAKECGVDAGGLRSCSHRELCSLAPRPVYSVLGTERGQILPTFGEALLRYARQLRL